MKREEDGWGVGRRSASCTVHAIRVLYRRQLGKERAAAGQFVLEAYVFDHLAWIEAG